MEIELTVLDKGSNVAFIREGEVMICCLMSWAIMGKLML